MLFTLFWSNVPFARVEQGTVDYEPLIPPVISGGDDDLDVQLQRKK